jgi:hypothetical protein
LAGIPGFSCAYSRLSCVKDDGAPEATHQSSLTPVGQAPNAVFPAEPTHLYHILNDPRGSQPTVIDATDGGRSEAEDQGPTYEAEYDDPVTGLRRAWTYLPL